MVHLILNAKSPSDNSKARQENIEEKALCECCENSINFRLQTKSYIVSDFELLRQTQF